MPLTITEGKDFDASKHPVVFSTSVEALEGAGKTQFSLIGTPPPVVHLNFGDRSAIPFLYDMDEERRKEVTLYDFQPSSSEGWARAEGMDSLQELSNIAQRHLSNGQMAGGTFVLDSGSTWWECIQECYVAPEQEKREAGGGKKTGGLEYMKGNLIVSGVVSWIKSQGAFVIITHRKRQDWGGSGPITGSYSAQINKKVPYLVEVRVDLYKQCAACGSEECRAKGHQGRVHKGRLLKFAANTAFEGLELENMDFRKVYELYTGKAPTW